MKTILIFIQNYFNINVLALFMVSSFFLIYMDCKEYKSKGLKKEYKFSMSMGIFYIAIGFIIYGIAKIINI